MSAEAIEHFSHEHPLIVCEALENSDSRVICVGCLQSISGTIYYKCIQCNFNLHKSCAELPNKIIHFMHPKHPLTLFAKSPYDNEVNCVVVCDDECDEKIWGFLYHCSLCGFDIGIKCALLQPIVEHESHQHLFILFRPTLFTCDVCNKTDNGKSYFCSICLLWIHKNCISIPETIVQKMDSLDCGTSSEQFKKDTTIVDYKNNQELDPTPNLAVSHEGVVRLISHDNVNEDINLFKSRRAIELEHFSHQHCLILSEDNPESYKPICDGCVELISSPFYKCDQCALFLHVSCAELPDTILHPFHPHPLTLLPLRYRGMDGTFTCYACDRWGNGFFYNCSKCEFYLDIRCTFFSNTLSHRGHEHTLNLVQKQTLSKCSACGVDCQDKFRCDRCDFNLDLQCASLPYTARHKCHRHKWEIRPLHLTYSSVEEKYGDYYCDRCEKRRGQNHWFYHCADCNYELHTNCVIRDYLIKVRET